MQTYFLYILECADKSYYVGHTDDLEKRLFEHNNHFFKTYTASRLPVKLVFQQLYETRTQALTAEIQIKKWSRRKKEALISGDFKRLSEYSRKKFK